MPPHAERNTPDHAHKSQDRSIRLPASSCTTTICRSPSRGVDGLRSHPRASRGRSMQDPASELPRISLLGNWVNTDILRRFSENTCVCEIVHSQWESMHAYGILAHKNLGQLLRLVRTLDTGQASFFLHIDKRADTAPYEQELGDLRRMPNVEFVKRYHSPWASFGTVRAQRAAMEAALRAQPRFTHVTLLTGQDYPIRPPYQIDAFFDAHRGTSFVEYGAKNRRNFKMHKYRFQNWWVYLAGQHWKIPLRKVGIRRSIPGGMRAYRGWAFFTLSR